MIIQQLKDLVNDELRSDLFIQHRKEFINGAVEDPPEEVVRVFRNVLLRIDRLDDSDDPYMKTVGALATMAIPIILQEIIDGKQFQKST